MSFQLKLPDRFNLTTCSCILQNTRALRWFYLRVASTHTLRSGEEIHQGSFALKLNAHPLYDGYSAMQ